MTFLDLSSYTIMEYTNDQLLAMIRGTEEEMNKALHYFFDDKKFRENLIARIMKEKGAQLSEAEDAFQDTFVPFVKYIIKPDFQLTTTLKGVFTTICVNKGGGFRKLAHYKKVKGEGLDDLKDLHSDELSDDALLEIEKKARVRWLLDNVVSEKCQELMWLAAYKQQPEDEESLESPKKKPGSRQALSKCRKKLRAFLKTKDSLYQEFKNYAIGEK